MKHEIKYKTFKIPKATKGFRIIEEPVGEGKEILKRTLRQIQDTPELKPSYFCHSFMKSRNILTCARQHKGNKVVIRMDIKDFFPNVTWEKFYDVALKPREWYSEIEEKIKETKKAKKIHEDIKHCFKYDKKRKVHYLPQGAPTSPALSNAYLTRFDWECAWYCYRKGVVYNRYADDIYLSMEKYDTQKLWSCVFCISNKMERIHLKEHRDKRKIMYPGKRMNIVGIVINEGLNIPRKKRKIIRAILHNAGKNKKPLNCEQKGLIAFQDMIKTYKRDIKNNLLICKEYELLDKI